MRLIDADALHKAYMELRNFKQDPQSGDWISLKAVPLTTVIRMLNDAPSIDIEPKRGEWIEENGRVICSECRCNALRTMTGCLMDRHLDYNKSNFCPNCGADMRKEGE